MLCTRTPFGFLRQPETCFAPNGSKFEALQKKVVKWINNETFINYSRETYICKCKDLDVLPLELRFKLNDLLFFHKIINNLISVSLANYIKPYGGTLRLRSTFLDLLSYIYDSSFGYPTITNTNSVVYRSLYYGTILLTKTTAAQNEVAFGYHKVRGL